MVDVGSSDEDKEEKEYHETLQKLKNANLKKDEQRKKGILDDDDDDDEEAKSDSDDDSDYEYAGGELALYDSALDDIDEIAFIKETLEGLC